MTETDGQSPDTEGAKVVPQEQPPQHQPTLQEMAQYARAMEAGRLDAELVFRHLMQELAEFEDGLDEDQEVVLQLANFGAPQALHIRRINFQNPNMIEFDGVLDNNRQIRVLQHINQLNVIMSAAPPASARKPYRIGFKMGAPDGNGAKTRG